VDKIAKKINDHDSYVHHHVSLSLFILAEVVDNIPRAIRSSAPSIHQTQNLFHSLISNLFYGDRPPPKTKKLGCSIDCLLDKEVKKWPTRSIGLFGPQFGEEIEDSQSLKWLDIETKKYSSGFSFLWTNLASFLFGSEMFSQFSYISTTSQNRKSISSSNLRSNGHLEEENLSLLKKFDKRKNAKLFFELSNRNSLYRRKRNKKENKFTLIKFKFGTLLNDIVDTSLVLLTIAFSTVRLFL